MVIMATALVPALWQTVQSRLENIYIIQSDSGLFIPPPTDGPTLFFFSQHPLFPVHCSWKVGLRWQSAARSFTKRWVSLFLISLPGPAQDTVA